MMLILRFQTNCKVTFEQNKARHCKWRQTWMSESLENRETVEIEFRRMTWMNSACKGVRRQSSRKCWTREMSEERASWTNDQFLWRVSFRTWGPNCLLGGDSLSYWWSCSSEMKISWFWMPELILLTHQLIENAFPKYIGYHHLTFLLILLKTHIWFLFCVAITWTDCISYWLLVCWWW